MIIRDKTNYVMTTATTLTALVKQQDSAFTATATTIAAVIKIQCAIRIFVSRNKRDELYIRHIKSQAKVLKKIRQKEKNTRRLHQCAIIIQKNIRMYLIIRRCRRRRRRQNILQQHKKDDKSKNRREECLVLRRNINALKKQISDIHVEREDDGNNRNYHIMDQNKNRRRKQQQKYSFFGIESLQAEYRSLNIQNKTLDDVLQPLQKNLNSFITENEQLKNEFHDIHTKNELFQLQNKQSLLLYKDTIQKTNNTKKQLIELFASTSSSLSSSTIEITTVHEQRMDIERRLFSSIEFIQSNNNDKKLINDVVRIGQQAQLEVKQRQGVAVATAAAGFVEPTFQSKNMLLDIDGVVSSSSSSPNKETPIIEQQQRRTPTSNRTKIGHNNNNNNNNNNKREAMVI